MTRAMEQTSCLRRSLHYPDKRMLLWAEDKREGDTIRQLLAVPVKDKGAKVVVHVPRRRTGLFGNPFNPTAGVRRAAPTLAAPKRNG